MKPMLKMGMNAGRWTGAAGLLLVAAALSPRVVHSLNVTDNLYVNYNASPYAAGNAHFDGSLYVDKSINAGSQYSIASTSAGIGSYNYVVSGESLAVGDSNDIYGGGESLSVGYNNDNSAKRTATLGMGLIADTEGAVVVGKYNDETITGEVFVVGNGSSGAGNEKNALEVYGDGRVVIPEPHGDVPMYQAP